MGSTPTALPGWHPCGSGWVRWAWRDLGTNLQSKLFSTNLIGIVAVQMLT